MNRFREERRRRILARAERLLRTNGSPRFHMLLIVFATGALAFLSSFLMLRLGVTAMWVRYPLAVGLSYAGFLGLIRLWLSYQTMQPPGGDRYHAAGDFLDTARLLPDGDTCIYEGPSAHGHAGGAASALDLDELFFVLVALVAVSAGFLVCLYVVWTGPSLLAEVLVDGVLMSRVYKRIKIIDRADWLPGLLWRTWFPAVLVALFFGIAAFAMQKIVPEATSIGPVVEHILRSV